MSRLLKSSRPSLLLGLLLLSGAATGCGDKDDGGDEEGSGEESGGEEGGDEGLSDWFVPDGGVVSLTTEDGITLAADYYPVDQEGAAAVVLLHMVPPSWDRSSWPPEFIEALGAAGWTVIVPDRRGAGDSEGEAEDAYQGPKGKYDAAAAVDRVVEDGYGSVAIIGASNGTTSTLDYTVWAAAEGHTVPAALGFMTGGTYTESQNDMEDLPELPAVFTFSTDERLWSARQEKLERTGWEFLEYEDGDHGTLMFQASPEVTADLVAFFQGVL